MSRQTQAIDWRREFKMLEPYLNGKGSVVKIGYEGNSYASHEFSEVVKIRYERKSDNQMWRSLRIDREWHTTRLLDEILSEFERILGTFNSNSDQEALNEVSNTINILDGAEFNGDAEISLDNVKILYVSDTLKTRYRDKRVECVCADLRRFLESGGHMMVVLNHAPAPEQSNFWTFLWDRGLKHLVGLGLLFIHMVDHSDNARGNHPCIPAPNLELNLPSRLEDQRQDDAYDDLVEVLQREIPGLSYERACGAAYSHINSHWQNIQEFHDKLFGLILKLGESVANKEMRR